MKKTSNLHKDQRGLVAITVTVFLMIMITLIVLSFGQISRRELRESVDRQLSSQAFYAAESGINDAVNYIRDPANISQLEKKECKTPAGAPASPLDANKNLDASGTFQQVCVLFNRAPKELSYSAVDGYRGESISLKTAGATSVPKSITIEWWGEESAGGLFTGCKTSSATDLVDFPTKAAYSTNCSASILKILLMPVTNGAISRERLVDDSYTIYARPVSDSSLGTANYSRHASGADNQGYVAAANCSAGRCKITINNIIPANGLYLRLSSIYTKSNVNITGVDATGAVVQFNDAQAIVDSTGKANDVLRRLQVRVPLYAEPTVPPGFEAMNGICKRLNVYTSYADSIDCSGDAYFL